LSRSTISPTLSKYPSSSGVSDRKTDSVRDQRDAADQIVNGGADRASSINAIIHRDLKNVEIAKVIMRPLVDRRAVADADRRIWPS